MSVTISGDTGLAGAATGALNGTLGATTPSTVVATTVVASSTIKGATTIAVGNATPSASGAGITFPATQSASTDANTLDDYEEGTWTPGQDVGLTVVGAFSSSGTYTKIGNVVTITGSISAATSLAFTGTGRFLKDLPFSAVGGHIGTGRNAAYTASAFFECAGLNLYAVGNLAATTNFTFSATYTV